MHLSIFPYYSFLVFPVNLGTAREGAAGYIAWFAVYSSTLSQLLRMHVMATPYIFYLSKKYQLNICNKEKKLNIAATQNL